MIDLENVNVWLILGIVAALIAIGHGVLWACGTSVKEVMAKIFGPKQ